MRREAGRTLEIQIWIIAAVILSVVAGAWWKPWGYLAGPGLLLLGFAAASAAFALSERRARAGLAQLLEIAATPASTPPPERLKAFVDAVSTADPAQIDALLKAARDPAHPAREALCGLCLKLRRDDDVRGVVAAFLLDHPEAESAWELAEAVVRDGPPELAERVARRALAAGTERAARSAARQLVYRGVADPRLAGVVRELRTEIDARLKDEYDRKAFAKLTAP